MTSRKRREFAQQLRYETWSKPKMVVAHINENRGAVSAPIKTLLPSDRTLIDAAIAERAARGETIVVKKARGRPRSI